MFEGDELTDALDDQLVGLGIGGEGHEIAVAGGFLDRGDAGLAAQACRGGIGLASGQGQRHRVVVARAGKQTGGRAVGDDAAAVDDHGAGADRIHFFQQMGRDDDGLFRRHAADQLAHAVLLIGIEAVGRLVHHQDRRIVQDRLGEADAALEALGQSVDRLLQDRLEFGLGGGFGGALLGFRAGKAADLRDEIQELARRHVAIGGRAFRQIAEARLRGDGVGLDIMAADRDAARRRREIARDHLHGGGFAGAVGAEEAQHLAFGDGKVDAGDGGNGAEIPGQFFNDDHVISHLVVSAGTRQWPNDARGSDAGVENAHFPRNPTQANVRPGRAGTPAVQEQKAGPEKGPAKPIRKLCFVESRSAEPSRPAGAGGLGQTPGRATLSPTDCPDNVRAKGRASVPNRAI